MHRDVSVTGVRGAWSSRGADADPLLLKGGTKILPAGRRANPGQLFHEGKQIQTNPKSRRRQTPEEDNVQEETKKENMRERQEAREREVT